MANLYFDNNINQSSKTIQIGKGTDSTGNTISVPMRAYVVGQFTAPQYTLTATVTDAFFGSYGVQTEHVKATIVPSTISFAGSQPQGIGGRRESVNGTITVNVTAFPEANVNSTYIVTIRAVPVGSELNDEGMPLSQAGLATINVQVFAPTVVNGIITNPGAGGNPTGGATNNVPTAPTPQPGADIPFNMLFVKGIIPGTVINNVAGGFGVNNPFTVVEANSSQIYRINSLSIAPTVSAAGLGSGGFGNPSQTQYVQSGLSNTVVTYNGLILAVISNFMNSVNGVLRYNVITKEEPIYVMPNAKLQVSSQSGEYTVICSYEILQF